jgi:hypothetical protein
VCADNYPLLEQLNRETQSLYREVQGGLVRVQLPTPKWIRDAAAKDDPLARWANVIDPQVKQRIDEQRLANARAGAPQRIETVILHATTQPTTGPIDAPPGWTARRQKGSQEIILEPRSSDAAAITIHAGPDGAPGEKAVGGPLQLKPLAPGGFAPNNLGLILDDVGHLLVPLYIEKETLENARVRVMVGDTESIATFVGSDEKTNVTVLKLEKPIGHAIRISPTRPAEGALVMLLNPNSGAGRLQLWTGGERDYGVVVSMDGSIAGISRFGQFLNLAACKPVLDQIITLRQVRRAVLGVHLTELRRDDPARRQLAALAQRPALVVDDVAQNSAAAKAGLKAADLILEVEDQPVGDLVTWSALSARAGDARILILRDGKPIHITLNFRAGN